MKQLDMVYDYLKNNYQEDEPILLSELSIPGMKAVSIRQQLKKLTEDGRLKRFDAGVYFLPKRSIFRSGSAISVDDVIRRKYLTDGDTRCGYVGGMLFANQLGLTTQVPMVYEVYTNKATTDYRETRLADIRVVLRRPYVEVDEKNVSALQFLDLMKELPEISELEGPVLTDRLVAYMKSKKIGFDTLRPYLPYYPERIYKNMYEVGLLDGIST